MSTLLAIMLMIVVYVKVFKDDFKTEDIEKVAPLLVGVFVVVAVFTVVIGILQG